MRRSKVPNTSRGLRTPNQMYRVTYTTETGFSETMETDTEVLRNLVRQEMESAKPKLQRDGSVAYDYGFKINNITTDHTFGRSLEFFSPGISPIDKYVPGEHGCIIKDTRTNFKGLANGTDAILVFDSKQEAKNYYYEHEDQIKTDYVAQKDSYFGLNDIIHESVTCRDPNSRLDLTGKGILFPNNNLYTTEDIAKISCMVKSYDDYHRRNEYVQNLKYIQPTFDTFVENNAHIDSDGLVHLNIDNFDSDFRWTFDHFVRQYPEMVNNDINKDMEVIRQKQAEVDAKRRLSRELDDAYDSFRQIAEERDMIQSANDGLDYGPNVD